MELNVLFSETVCIGVLVLACRFSCRFSNYAGVWSFRLIWRQIFPE